MLLVIDTSIREREKRKERESYFVCYQRQWERFVEDHLKFCLNLMFLDHSDFPHLVYWLLLKILCVLHSSNFVDIPSFPLKINQNGNLFLASQIVFHFPAFNQFLSLSFPSHSPSPYLLGIRIILSYNTNGLFP